MKTVPRVQEIVIPILRDHFGDSVKVGSWLENIDFRSFPSINVRRLGGYNSSSGPRRLDFPVVELTVYHEEGLVEAEDMYLSCLDALFEAQRKQIVTDKGTIAHVQETMGMTNFPSQYQDTFRVQGLIELGIRPSRKEP